MPLKKGKAKTTIEKNTKTLIKEGYSAKQAYAIANAVAKVRKAGRK